MTIVRINGSGWGIGDKLTSAQMNGVDINATYGIDRRAGQTDTFGSVVTATGAGRIVGTYAVGANADTTYFASGANSTIDCTTAITADRVYTLGNTNAVANDRIIVLNRSNFYIRVEDAAANILIVLGNAIQGNGESGWAEFLFTGSTWVLLRSALRPTLAATEFLVDGSYTWPRGVTLCAVMGYGGGGGGGGGGTGGTGLARSSVGGGGGGASLRVVRFVTGTPGSVSAVTIGVGGTGGGGGSPGGNGSDAGDTFFGGTRFLGASGGTGGSSNESGVVGARGGGPVRQLTSFAHTRMSLATEADRALLVQLAAGHGGAGFSFYPGFDANSALERPHTATLGGAAGTTNGDAFGGGGGGGGAAGPGGTGSLGGAGGAGGNAGNGGAGSSPGNAPANSGAGGGGGGAGGQCTHAGSPGAGGTGGNGGSGYLIVLPIR